MTGIRNFSLFFGIAKSVISGDVITMIPGTLLKKYHASPVPLEKGDILFHFGDPALSFFIVQHGKMKMSNYSDDGKEFVQGYFTDGQSFGEPPFFANVPYPASAIATEKSSVWKISRENFLQLLKENFDIHLQVTSTLSGRLIYKSTMLSEMAIEEAEHRLVTLMHYFADHDTQDRSTPYKLPLTRQQLADMTGLRVETVIRSIKSLEQKKYLSIGDDGKILWKNSR
ncbi:MAG: Crp/Fnr family transcriptional regulator [Bacteroidota bacterium]|jgi:CRP-like cAMP-binding protein